MNSGANETKDALKKKLVETKDQVTILKERTTEVCQGKWLVHRNREMQLVVTRWRANY
jgi:hypothetical protein